MQAHGHEGPIVASASALISRFITFPSCRGAKYLVSYSGSNDVGLVRCIVRAPPQFMRPAIATQSLVTVENSAEQIVLSKRLGLRRLDLGIMTARVGASSALRRRSLPRNHPPQNSVHRDSADRRRFDLVHDPWFPGQCLKLQERAAPV